MDINSDRNNRKPSNSWELNNSILNDYCVNTEIKMEIKDFNKTNAQHTQLMGHNESGAKVKVHSIKVPT